MQSNYRPRVLCIDDDEDARVMLRSLLALAHVEAETVETAAKALALTKTERFDMYVLDAWLPKTDGFELCQRLRALDRHKPIVFFSGLGYEADKKKGFKAGASAYVVKPDIGELLRSIQQFVAQPEMATAEAIPSRPELGLLQPFTLEPIAA